MLDASCGRPAGPYGTPGQGLGCVALVMQGWMPQEAVDSAMERYDKDKSGEWPRLGEGSVTAASYVHDKGNEVGGGVGGGAGTAVEHAMTRRL
jgi:hypothetical protein